MNFYKNQTLVIITAISLISCKETKKENPQTETEPMTEEKSKPETIELLTGTYTDETSKGIYLLSFNPADGSLENKGLVAETVSPSYLDISNDRQFVFAVNEDDPGYVSSFKWNDDRTKLNLINQQPSKGAHPCFIELNKDENQLALANYSSGNIAVYTVAGGGNISESPEVRQHEGSGPVTPNQKSAHAHCSKFDTTGKFLYVADLGIDEIVSYPLDENGKPGEKQTALALDKGDGPRHFIFHPNKNMAFIVNELSGSVVSAKIDPEKGLWERIDKKSTLPEDYTGTNACADIHITSNGKFLYASNRGHNSIAVFKVAEDGTLEKIANEHVQGEWPRNFTLSPDEKHLIVANKDTDNITVFGIDPETGLLTYTGNQVTVSKPVCLKF